MNKKLLLSFASLAVATILTGGLTSCSHDEDSHLPTPTFVDKSGNKWQITNLNNFHFVYDESGKLGLIGDGKECIAAQDGKFVFIYNGATAFAYINKEGLLTKAEYKSIAEGGSSEGCITLSYSDRRLTSGNISLTATGKNYNFKGTEKIDYVWQNGNLVQVSIMMQAIEKINGKISDIKNSTMGISFIYGNQVNHTKQLPYYMGCEINDCGDFGGLFGAAGLLGYGPAYLPTDYTIKTDDKESIYRLTFRQNPNGTINTEQRGSDTPIAYGYHNIESRADGIDIKSLEQCVRSLGNLFRHKKH